MKTWEEINIKEPLCSNDFNTLFNNLPLNKKEIKELDNYYAMYITFIQNEVNPEIAWLAIRNMFIIKNQQLHDRIK